MLALCLIGLRRAAELQQPPRSGSGSACCRSWRSIPSSSDSAHWPQVVLGLAFNWGALLGWPRCWAGSIGRRSCSMPAPSPGPSATTRSMPIRIARTTTLLGLKSTALRFGRATKAWLALLYALAWLGDHRGGHDGRCRDGVPAGHDGGRRRSSPGRSRRSISTMPRIASSASAPTASSRRSCSAPS